MNRDFKGIWIPKAIWERKDLNSTEKIIISEIDSLDSGDGCWAGNKHFSDLLQIGKESVSNNLGKLRDKGIIEITENETQTRRMLKVVGGSHLKMVSETSGSHADMVTMPFKNGLYKEENTVNNTTTIVPVEPSRKQVELAFPIAVIKDEEPLGEKAIEIAEVKAVEVKRQLVGCELWDNAKTNLQKLMAYYVGHNMNDLYHNGTKERVNSFFKQYGHMFSRMLGTAGDLETAQMAVDEAERYYRRLGFPWGLKALNTNWGAFVNTVMENRRKNAGK